MKVIVITLPDEVVENEVPRIVEMLDCGLIDRVHIRKPEMSLEGMRRLIANIPTELHSRLSIHSNPQLLTDYPLVGWHFSSARPKTKCGGPLSRSCHSPAEAMRWIAECDYMTLSPVFDSISKPGYLSACFNPVEEHLCNQAATVIALGGVTPKRFPRLKERGYRGAAMLGYAWKTELKQLIEELKCYNS